MDYSRSPEDNTSVIKMVNGLRSFLGHPQYRTTRQSLDPSQNLSDLFSLGSSQNTSSTSQRKRSMNDHYKTLSRDEKADMIVAKSKAAKLEDEIETMKMNKQQYEIEEEKNRKINSNKTLKEQEECDLLRQKFKRVVDQKQTAIDDLSELQKLYDTLKSSYNEETKKWQLEKTKLQMQLQHIESSSNEHISKLKDQSSRHETELVVLRNKNDEMEVQMKMYQSRRSETNEIIADYQDLKSRCEIAEHKVKMLEEKASRIHESSMLMQKNQAEFAKFRELQRENKLLLEDNKLHRDAAENALILQEKVSHLNSKLARYEKKIEELGNLEFENEKLRVQIRKWDSTDIFDGNATQRSPGELTRMIAELQKSQLSMIEKQGELEASVTIKDATLSNKYDECSRLHEVSIQLQTKNEQLEDKCQKLLRRFTLVSSDRDGLRRVLSSYENEDGTQIKIGVQEAEKRMKEYEKQIEELENDLLSAKKECSQQKTLYLLLQLEHEKFKAESCNTPAMIQKAVETQEIKRQLEELHAQHAKLREEKEILEIRLERKELQGDYDPLKTKVLQVKCNPMLLAREAYLREMADVKVQNEKLSKKVLELQAAKERSQRDEDESMNVSQLIRNSKPVEEANRQLEAERLKSQRLKEQFSKTAKDFREAVFSIFGFRFILEKDDTYRVQSIYSETQDDFFLFTCAKNKDGGRDTGMIETAYARDWMEFQKDYLQNGDSIPAFLASVTLELFSRMTQIRDLTLAKKAKQL